MNWNSTSWALRSPVVFGVTMVILMFGIKILALPLIASFGGSHTTAPNRSA